MGLTEATKEALYLRSLLHELGVREKIPVKIFNDNKSAHHISNNPAINNRTKHIDIKYHFIRNAVLERKIQIKYLDTKSMPADIFTKPLPICKFNNCCIVINVICNVTFLYQTSVCIVGVAVVWLELLNSSLKLIFIFFLFSYHCVHSSGYIVMICKVYSVLQCELSQANSEHSILYLLYSVYEVYHI